MEYLKKYWYLLVVVLLLLEYYVFQFTIFSKKGALLRIATNPEASKNINLLSERQIILLYRSLVKGEKLTASEESELPK